MCRDLCYDLHHRHPAGNTHMWLPRVEFKPREVVEIAESIAKSLAHSRSAFLWGGIGRLLLPQRPLRNANINK